MIPKFRAWDKEYKAMEYTDRNLVVCFSHIGVDVVDHTNFTTSCIAMEDYELMQSTGLKDKNDVEIFEGDVISCFSEGLSVVEYRYGGFGLVFNEYFESFANVLGGVEVLGNIYEHPHLLEE